MNRSALALLCFSLLFSCAVAADPAPSSPSDTYISARDRYIAEFVAHPVMELSDKREEMALSDLERQLKQIIPPWRAPGFPAEGRINLDTLSQNELGFALLDGLRYDVEGRAAVVVTNTHLVKRWIATLKRDFVGYRDFPRSLGAAMDKEDFYTSGIVSDEAVVFYGRVPVVPPGGSRVASAHLIAKTQEVVLDQGPTELFITIVRGRRIFIATQKLSQEIKPLPSCQAAMRREMAESDAGRKGHDYDRADKIYRRCFIAKIRKSPQWKPLVRQAQSLADLLR